jgi:hypothetical protein
VSALGKHFRQPVYDLHILEGKFGEGDGQFRKQFLLALFVFDFENVPDGHVQSLRNLRQALKYVPEVQNPGTLPCGRPSPCMADQTSY